MHEPKLKRLAGAVAMLALAAGLVGCDHATKALAVRELRGKPPHSVVAGVLELRYAENRDIAFSLLRGVPSAARNPLIALGALLAAGALAIAWRTRRPGNRTELAALALITAGGLGNVLDRVFRGYVVDFIHPTHYAIFNVADAYLVVGIALLVLTQRRRAAPA